MLKIQLKHGYVFQKRTNLKTDPNTDAVPKYRKNIFNFYNSSDIYMLYSY